MLNYAGEYCDACQAAVTAITGGDAALKFSRARLTMCYVIDDGVGTACNIKDALPASINPPVGARGRLQLALY